VGDAVARYATLGEAEIGTFGAGGKVTVQSHRVVAVLNTAAKRLSEMAESIQALMWFRPPASWH
jgi:hypothetical protein